MSIDTPGHSLLHAVITGVFIKSFNVKKKKKTSHYHNHHVGVGIPFNQDTPSALSGNYTPQQVVTHLYIISNIVHIANFHRRLL